MSLPRHQGGSTLPYTPDPMWGLASIQGPLFLSEKATLLSFLAEAVLRFLILMPTAWEIFVMKSLSAVAGTWRCDGTAHVTRVEEYRLFGDINLEVEEKQFMRALMREQWEWMKLCLGMGSAAAESLSGLVSTPRYELLWNGCLLQNTWPGSVSKQIKLSSDNCKKPHILRPWPSWGLT